MKRKRSQPHTFEDQLRLASQDNRARAAKLPPGRERMHLLEKARQIDAAAKLNAWLKLPISRAAR